MLIRGGTVVASGGERVADVLIRDGRVVAVGGHHADEGDIIDATGHGGSEH